MDKRLTAEEIQKSSKGDTIKPITQPDTISSLGSEVPEKGIEDKCTCSKYFKAAHGLCYKCPELPKEDQAK